LALRLIYAGPKRGSVAPRASGLDTLGLVSNNRLTPKE